MAIPLRLNPLTALLALSVLVVAAVAAPGVARADDHEFEHDLFHRWSLIVWQGPDGIDITDALKGTGDAEGGNDVFDVVTAIYQWDGTEQSWDAYFPEAADLPGVNDLETLDRNQPYFIAINDQAGVTWSGPREAAGEPAETVRIGAALALTGPGSSLGLNTQAALEIAVAERNDAMEAADRDIEFVLDVEDTALDPSTAETAFRDLVDRGAHAVIGGQSSAEFAVLGPLADDEEVLLVSYGSTASALSGLHDYAFRFVPTDVLETQATVELMEDDGINSVIPMWREDSGNEGLADGVKDHAADAGFDVATGISYATDETDFTDELNDLLALVENALDDAETDEVAVYLAGFEEVADILAAANGVDGLEDVRWYGGDGSANSSPVLTVAGSGEFALEVGGFPSPLVALPAGATATYADLIDAIESETGSTPDAFALAAYDAFNVLAEALTTEGEAPRDAFLDIANPYEGVTGSIQLDAAGDRELAPYAFYSICDDGEGGYEWVQTDLWEPGAAPGDEGTLTRGSCASPVD